MKQIDTLEERHRILLDILVEFNSLCKKNGVQYMLAYGTLLGAVRHKGFIPWDDDIDIMMTRDEYEKFIDRYHYEEDARYKFISKEIDPEYFSPLAKFYDDNTILIQKYGQKENENYGIYLDVFIIDSMPDDIKEAKRFVEQAEIIRFLWAMSVKDFNAGSRNLITKVVRIPLILVCRLVGQKFFMEKYNSFAQKYRNKETNHRGVIVYGEGFKKEFFIRTLFEDLENVEFEGFSFPAPRDYHSYLSQMYGDYMMIPKVCDRKIHPNDAFWK